MKKVIAMCLSLVLCIGLLAGCGTSGDTQESELSGVVNTDGSTSMEKVVKGLAEAFMEENGGVTVNYSGTGSGAGVDFCAVLNGTTPAEAFGDYPHVHVAPDLADLLAWFQN